jgi:hypothetical protein
MFKHKIILLKSLLKKNSLIFVETIGNRISTFEILIIMSTIGLLIKYTT